MNTPFYMLYVEDGGKPNQSYPNFDMALARAKVLAAETRHNVFILCSTHVVSADVPPVEPTFTVSVL